MFRFEIKKVPKNSKLMRKRLVNPYFLQNLTSIEYIYIMQHDGINMIFYHFSLVSGKNFISYCNKLIDNHLKTK